MAWCTGDDLYNIMYLNINYINGIYKPHMNMARYFLDQIQSPKRGINYNLWAINKLGFFVL